MSQGKAPARKIKHAEVLLKIDSSEKGPNWSDKQVKAAFGVGETSIWRIRRRFLEQGLEDALNRVDNQNGQRSESWMESKRRI